jgi:hypothetical protein
MTAEEQIEILTAKLYSGPISQVQKSIFGKIPLSLLK